MKKPLVVIAGATATGKSALAVNIAKIIGGEIISADSMQVYKFMDVGTAKVTEEEMGGIKHYLLDCLNPNESCDALRYKTLALEAMDEIYKNGHIPIICGGTGFYIQAVLYDIDFTETDEDNTIRSELEERVRKEGTSGIYEELKSVDPESALLIHENNSKRVIRALEYYKKTGKKISEHNKEQSEKTSPYDFYYFVLTDDREVLYSRIDKRVDAMIEEGLVDEVKELMQMDIPKTATSMQSLGYREIFCYLDGEYDLDRAIYLIKRNTRHFAKRQLTWFRREKDVRWIDKSAFGRDDNLVLNEILRIYENE